MCVCFVSVCVCVCVCTIPLTCYLTIPQSHQHTNPPTHEPTSPQHTNVLNPPMCMKAEKQQAELTTLRLQQQESEELKYKMFKSMMDEFAMENATLGTCVYV